ncbi:MAG: hypothetical protein IKF98_01170, partial [Clostridia bacterium]|nr:hypothetical protein [Clostridia bacterium]
MSSQFSVTLSGDNTPFSMDLPPASNGQRQFFGSSRKVVGCTSLYAKFRCVTGATIAFATVLFTAKPCRVMKSYMPKSH